MFKFGYIATSMDLSFYTTGAIKLDRSTGMPQTAYKRLVVGLPPGEVELPRWITVRPGLSSGMNFYGVLHTELGTLVCMSDRSQTRYYWFGRVKRETVIFDTPSQSFAQAIKNLFCGLVLDERASHSAFYASVAHLILAYFLTEQINQSFTVEGMFKQTGEHYVAELAWSRGCPGELLVSSTLDKEQSRKVSLFTHPIAEVHKQCLR